MLYFGNLDGFYVMNLIIKGKGGKVSLMLHKDLQF